ncbi:DUF916 and DUF3324 domain-containing protein [Pseudolactococcus reticulitermitis]|uniref:Uncharacterized protein n=1 Tax=Pseudolactococcus reticulitermitis TaxID=2025039 RepID=A0A224XCY5_9LACT|nr:DUF916 and DUF3324 domain-containing protein [Lactococcus reticulitermitis]GAX47525.1 hypothetical protein RsY01_1125 [Lactococcus reticulitermitis]
MLKKNIKVMMMGALVFALFVSNGDAKAETAASQGYSIAKLEAGKEVEDSSIFNLLMTPGEKRTIKVTVRNDSNQPITVSDDIFTTYTNANGEIEYTSQADHYDESMQVKLSDIAKVRASDLKVEVPAKSQKVVLADIALPDDISDGALLGSWYFDKDGQIDENETNKGTSIKNKINYAIALKITVNQEVAKPELTLTSASIGLSNYRKAFFAHLQNPLPALMTNLDYEGYVTKQGETKALYQNELQKRKMAPQSSYQFPIFLKDDEFKAGNYTYHLKATTTDPKWEKKTWEWTKNFSIKADEAKKFNQQAINDVTAKTNWILWLILAGSVIVLFIICFIFLLMKRKKRQQEAAELLAQKKLLEHLLAMKDE